jgi:hypothetical protein
VSRRLRRLDGLLGIDDGRRTGRRWMIPAAVLIGTILAFLVIGAITHAPLEVTLPNGVVIAGVMAGLAIACMNPNGDSASTDDPPGGDGPTPVLGSPGGPWVVVAHLGRAPVEPPGDPSPVPPGQREAVTATRP